MYLKPTIKAEPLIWRWYAWAYLVFPTTIAAKVAERHLRIMRSYLQNPQIHRQAVKGLKLLGGLFIDFETNKVEGIKNLIALTNQECRSLIVLNNAPKEIDKLLQSEAKGDFLERIYQKIPEVLKGMIELVYDLNNHPSLRLIQPFFYKTYYKTDSQAIALSHVTSNLRKFVLNMPRLDQEEISQLFDIPLLKQNLFKSFFTSVFPLKVLDRNYEGEGVRLRYFGHAGVLVQTREMSILFDPIVSQLILESERLKYTFEDLPAQIDYVVITYKPQDHLMSKIFLQLGHKIRRIVFSANHRGVLEDLSIKIILQHTEFKSLIELTEMQTISLKEREIINLSFLGEHSDLNIQSKLSYCIKLKGKIFMFAAGSNNLRPNLYDYIVKCIGPVEMQLLGMEYDSAALMWLYGFGPLLSTPLGREFDRNRALSRSNFEEAWSIIGKLQCKSVYVYAMGQGFWPNYVMALKCSSESVQIIESDKFDLLVKPKTSRVKDFSESKEWIFS